MASISSLADAKEIGKAIKHDLRIDTSCSPNMDIDSNRSPENYSLHGDNYDEVDEFINEHLENIFIHHNTHPAYEIVIQTPPELPKDEEPLFFETCHRFLEKTCGADNCIAASVHVDEAGQHHIHELYFKPSVINEKYISAEEKQVIGYAAIENRFNITVSEEQRDKLADIIESYEDGHTRDKTIFRTFADELSITRDDARWAVRQLRRTEVEIYEKRIDSAFLNKEFYDSFHDKLQEAIDEAGLHCNVHKGNTEGRGWTVIEKKAEDRIRNAEEELIQARKEISILKNEIDRKEDELDALYEKLDSRDQEIEQLQSEIERLNVTENYHTIDYNRAILGREIDIEL